MTPEFEIAGRRLGPDHPTYFIAEIGSNHDGRLERAAELVRAAAGAGADAVKLQSFRAAGLTRRSEPAFALLEALELPADWLAPLGEVARSAGVALLSTPFDEACADQLCAAGLPALKIASGDLTHHPLLRHVGGLGLPVLVSTGLAELDEVRAATEVLDGAGAPAVALLHCVSTYPTRFPELNLRVLPRLADAFGRVVGLSDHSPRHAAVAAAVALGARVVEKHVTFDRELEGPDHAYALTIEEFAAMVRDVRDIEAALGDGEKRPAPEEAAGRRLGRRSVHAATDIPAGARLVPGMLKIVRPADGAPPWDGERLLGRSTRRALRCDEPVCWADVR